MKNFLKQQKNFMVKHDLQVWTAVPANEIHRSQKKLFLTYVTSAIVQRYISVTVPVHFLQVCASFGFLRFYRITINKLPHILLLHINRAHQQEVKNSNYRIVQFQRYWFCGFYQTIKKIRVKDISVTASSRFYREFLKKSEDLNIYANFPSN